MNNSFVRRTLLLLATTLALGACEENIIALEEPWDYRITEGACGTLVFAESLGADSAAAMAVVEAQEVARYGEGNVTVVPYLLQVVDKNGNVPEVRFYAVRVLDALNGTHLHSVSDVITTEGDLFWLSWCPD